MKRGLSYCALDVSADRINAALALVNRKGEIVDIDCRCGISKGMKNDRIVNAGQFAEAIAKVIGELETKSSRKIKYVYVSIRSPHVYSRHSIGIIPISDRANKVITSSDVRKVNEQAYSLGLNIEEEVLHQIPQVYIVDNQNKVLNPEGLYGHKIEVDLILISVLAVDLEGMISAIGQAGFSTRAVLLSGFASSLAVLRQGFKDKGLCFLDIGFDSTQMLVFKDGILRGFESFSFGSNSLTQAIASELKVSWELAEDIKVSYGSCLSANVDPLQEILIKKDQNYRPIKRKVICSIIERYLQDQLGAVKEKLERYRKNFDLPQGIIACGNAALLEGFLENLEINLGLGVRLARIEDVSVKDINYATCVGLIKYAAASIPQLNPFRFSSYGTVFQKLAHKSKEIYQEYF